MPKIDIADIEGKKTLHPELGAAKRGLVKEKPERIAIEADPSFARKAKAAAKMQGLSIKEFVTQALTEKMERMGIL